MEDWKRRADSLYWFVAENVDEKIGGYTLKDDFYEAYAEFAEDRGLMAKKPEIVGKELPRLLPKVRSERPRIGADNKQVRVWANIVLRPRAGVESEPSDPETGKPADAKRAIRGDLVEEVFRKVRWDAQLRQMSAETVFKWLVNDTMLRHQFDETN